VVFLGLPMAINVRDVLRTDAWRALLDAGLELHLFTPAAGVPEFRAEFAGPGVHIHPIAAPASRAFEVLDAAVLKFHVLLLSLRSHTARIMIGPTLDRSALARMARGTLRVLGRRAQDALLRCSRWVTLRFAPELYGEAFAAYRPDLVIGTRAITMTGPRTLSSPRYLDRHLLMSAARRGIPTMVLVSSWDNLTTSGFFPVEVDTITVWNEIMRREAGEIHGLRPEQVIVTGAPQHDIYAAGAPFVDRATFMRGMGLDPARPFVLYTTGTEGAVVDEPELVRSIVAALRARDAALQFVVRLHQLDRIERYAALNGMPDVALDQAGSSRVGDYPDRDFGRAQMERLADSLRHAAVVINVASSISIDAAAVGSPVVCVDYDARPGLPYHRSARRAYDFTHQVPVITSGAVARARDPGELVAAVERYLRDPAADAESRERLVREQCYRIDGRSARRVGEAVLQTLENRLARGARHR
jgi:hypothetical protein